MVRTGAVIALVAQVVLLAAIAGTVGLSPVGWVVGIAYGVVMNALLAVGLARARARTIGPANVVTLCRATLVGAVTALVADSFVQSVSVPTVVALAAVALVLDAVDGRVARRTRTVSTLGGYFDQEVDAFLILVLSVGVASSIGPWVLVIGVARYAFLVAGWPLRWLRTPAPRRQWGKAVAAIQGIVLTAALAGVLPRPVTVGAVAVALALLTLSFGYSVQWLWRAHRAERSGSYHGADRHE